MDKEKILLYAKKYWYYIVIFLLALPFLLKMAWQMFMPRKTVTLNTEADPRDNPLEEVKAPNFYKKMIKAKKENDEKIDNLSRRDFIDSVNNKYDKGSS